MKPIIAMTPSFTEKSSRFSFKQNYAEAIRSCGGIPILLPFPFGDKNDIGEEIKQLAGHFDGILIPGGFDVNPSFYGQVKSDKEEGVVDEKDIYEIALCRYAFENDIPLLGICRGCQVMTVSAGGTLERDIPNHVQPGEELLTYHSADVKKGNLLYDIVKSEKIEVNSFHHQCACTTGDLKVCAYSYDGHIEAVCGKGKFQLGVQWHPERSFGKDIVSTQIFKAFMNACQSSL